MDNFYMHHSSNLIPIFIACNTAYLPRNTFSQIIARVKIGIFMALTITANYINFYTRLFMFPTSIRFFVSLIDFHFCFPLCCLNDRETVVIFFYNISLFHYNDVHLMQFQKANQRLCEDYTLDSGGVINYNCRIQILSILLSILFFFSFRMKQFQ